jgi:hypothetical protein
MSLTAALFLFLSVFNFYLLILTFTQTRHYSVDLIAFLHILVALASLNSLEQNLNLLPLYLSIFVVIAIITGALLYKERVNLSGIQLLRLQ